MFDVAVIPREKFSKTERCLQSLLPMQRHIDTLFFFDVGYPPSVRESIAPILNAMGAVTIAYESFRLANACLNDLQHHGAAPWILVIENDCGLMAFDPEAAIRYADANGFAVIQPRIMEGDEATIHYDPPQSYIHVTDDQMVHKVVRNPRQGFPQVHGQRRIFHVEKHAFLIRRDVLTRLGEFEDFLVTRSHWDLSFRLHASGDAILFDPALVVKFCGGAIEADDADYFFWRWDMDKARRSNAYLREKWHVVNYHSSLEWLEEMLRTLRVERAQAQQ